MTGRWQWHYMALYVICWTYITSCGTMPIPAMPQAKVVVKETTTASATSNKDADQSAVVSTVPSSEATEAPSKPDEEPELQGEPTAQAAFADGQTSIAAPSGSDAAVTTTPEVLNAATAPPALQTSPPVAEDILQQPVISNAPSSQTMLATVAPGLTASQAGQGEAYSRDAQSDLQSGKIYTTPRSQELAVPPFAVLTADDRVQNAINFLNEGEEQLAEKELADALVIEPNNRAARRLMRQINDSPENYFTQQNYFEYALQSNDTLVGVAERFLQDPLDFYILAKLNDIKDPKSIAPGKILVIPGRRDQSVDTVVTPASQEASKIQTQEISSENNEDNIKIERAKVYIKEHRYTEAVTLLKPYATKAPTAAYTEPQGLLAQSYQLLADDLIRKGNLLEAQVTLESSVSVLPGHKALDKQLIQVKNQREAERLYNLGIQESQNGDEFKAVETFTKALQLNPDHTQAKKQLIDLRLTVVEDYHKQAMILYRKQELSRAIEIWDDVLRIDPNHELARQYREKALELKQKFEQL